MGLRFKKLLVNMLVLMVVMLPFRDAFAMSMELSSKHCANDDMSMEMMNHAGHNMPASPDVDSEQMQASCNCCDQCDNACAGCTHISAIIHKYLFSNKQSQLASFTIDAVSSATRFISPPSRPPLAL